MTTKKAVLFLTYNRFATTKKVFESIRKYKPDKLYIASDGARKYRDGEKLVINNIRNYLIKNISWKCEVKTLFREENIGLRNSVSDSITWFFNNEEDGIILEDDCLPNQSFFNFCSSLLDKYRDNKKIMHISGNCFAPNMIDNSSYHFLKIQHCWGWACWSDRWKLYGKDLSTYSLKNLKKISDNPNVQNYWKSILLEMKQKKIDSWAYQWMFRIIEKDGLCINPSVNLVSNIGFDNNATHTKNPENILSDKLVYEIKKLSHPDKVRLDIAAVDFTYKNVFGIPSITEILKNENDMLKGEVGQLKQNNYSLEDKLNEIYTSNGWQLLTKIYQIREILIPNKITRYTNLKDTYHLIFPKKTQFYTKKEKKLFNKKSKKVVYIGHSYHSKTKSTRFLIAYLKEHFEVTEILDESWLGKPYPDLSFVDDNYLGIIMFQNIPSPQIVNSLKNQNIIFFPMFDGHGTSPKIFWDQYKNIKFINFSKTLHNKLEKWGFESIYIQYFPKPTKQNVTKENKIFLWQRTDKININLVEKLIGDLKTKIHIHKAVDPGFNFTQPTKKQETKFKITYSEWFPSRKEMMEVLSSCNIYIAPRELEGIGLSFLEAMAMGKVVIAPNNPTMNEYIIHNQNGYLYDLHNPQPINFNNIENIKKTIYETMDQGYLRWKNSKKNVINFIYKND